MSETISSRDTDAHNSLECSLADQDDDVRSVAAECLTPIAHQVVERLPEELERVMNVLWNCLSDMKDDLGSSVAGVMELLGMLLWLRLKPLTFILILTRDSYAGKLVSFSQVIGLLSDDTKS